MAIGAALAVAIFSIYALIKRRHKEARNERPPQQTKILRPAGYSLSRRIDELSEKFNMMVTGSVVAGMVLGLLLTGIYPIIEGLLLQRVTFSELRAQPDFYYAYSLGFLMLSAVAAMFGAIARSIQINNEMRNCQLGLRGEQVVAEELATPDLLATGYVSFHDVPGNGPWNIDHVVIGPSGIYVLETKTRARRKPTRDQRDCDVLYDGKKLQFPWCYDAKAAKQTERNAEWVRKFIDGFAPKDMPVQPIIVVPGWYAKSLGNYPVKVMPVDYLVKGVLLADKRLFTAEQLSPLIRRFDERCRDLEF
ncbi:MAG: NERD domain-containing protein [Patescibacteria group bacterium]|nr:NERD domain-containing protein [Patescibacteria group bacterium]